jgi:hypothetical protein
MAPPAFLAGPVGYTVIPVLTDWTAGIAAFQALVLGLTPAWTESPAGTFISPPDVGGRFFSVNLVRNTASRLEVRVRNDFGVIISNRSLDSIGVVRLYAGQFHFAIESSGGTTQTAGGGLLDQSARPQTSHANYVYGYGYLNNVFAYDGASDSASQYASVDNGTPAMTARALNPTNSPTGTIPLIHASGFSEHVPVKLSAQFASIQRRTGRLYQHFWVDNSFPVGTEIPIPVDTSPPTTGIFRVLNRADTYAFARTACRIA